MILSPLFATDALSGGVSVDFERASLELGRLDAWSTRQPDVAAQVTGFASTDPAISRALTALDWGLLQLRNGFPLSARLLRGVHGKLLNAPLAPLSSSASDGMDALERWLNDVPERTPPLMKAAVAVAHFTALQPFPTENGRVAQLLAPLIFCADGALREPSLYLLRALASGRGEFDEPLATREETGRWEPWLALFASLVTETSTDAMRTAEALDRLLTSDRERIRAAGRPTTSTLAVYDALCARPIDKAPLLAERTGLTLPTVNAALERLQTLGIVDEITGKRRNRTYRYSAYILRLSEGTEPL